MTVGLGVGCMGLNIFMSTNSFQVIFPRTHQASQYISGTQPLNYSYDFFTVHSQTKYIKNNVGNIMPDTLLLTKERPEGLSFL